MKGFPTLLVVLMQSWIGFSTRQNWSDDLAWDGGWVLFLSFSWNLQLFSRKNSLLSAQRLIAPHPTISWTNLYILTQTTLERNSQVSVRRRLRFRSSLWKFTDLHFRIPIGFVGEFGTGEERGRMPCCELSLFLVDCCWERERERERVCEGSTVVTQNEYSLVLGEVSLDPFLLESLMVAANRSLTPRSVMYSLPLFFLLWVTGKYQVTTSSHYLMIRLCFWKRSPPRVGEGGRGVSSRIQPLGGDSVMW